MAGHLFHLVQTKNRTDAQEKHTHKKKKSWCVHMYAVCYVCVYCVSVVCVHESICTYTFALL